jgi:hypothetical protein
MLNYTKDEIEKKLLFLIENNEWDTKRTFFQTKNDKNPFISASILAILNHVKLKNIELIQKIRDVRSHLTSYQKEHFVFHWPFNKNGKSAISNSCILGKIKYLQIDPDADCSVMQQLALNQKNHHENLNKSLEFFRFTKNKFRLSKQQSKYAEHRSFLTWFPEKKSYENKLETIDFVVQANILWYLGENNYEISGKKETLNSLIRQLHHPLFQKNSYRFSPYYPFVFMQLYAFTRTAFWGNYEILKNEINFVLDIAKNAKVKNHSDALYLLSIAKWTKNEYLKKKAENFLEKAQQWDKSPYYILAFTEFCHAFEFFSRKKIAQMNFYSDGLKWAVLRWLKENQ